MNLDWQRIVLNIRQAGMPVRSISRKVGMAPDTLGHYVRGECREPPFSKGLALLDLHHALCPEKHRLDQLKR